ncbi:MAG: ATP-binding cassette domain-containing protein [Campylobacter sp.]|nr:ATP-binding cassette domain-containing protein [Campylobacter sp.]
MMKIKNLNVKNGDKILLDDINLTLESGKVTALVGKSGSGKSLCVMTLLGLTPSNLKGEFQSSQKCKFALIMQNPKTAFNPLVSIKTHILECIKDKENSQILATLNEVGLGEWVLDRYSFELSGGELQRVMIAIAVLSGAKFILADEPTTDLDFEVSQKILELLKNLMRRKNIGILLVTHDFNVVQKMADKIYVIDAGKIVESADKDELFASPKHSVSKELLNAHFVLNGRNLC